MAYKIFLELHFFFVGNFNIMYTIGRLFLDSGTVYNWNLSWIEIEVLIYLFW
jgi:hypothetical protein